MPTDQLRQTGRPLDNDLTERILRETLESLLAGGYVNLKIERIASAVECGKTAIYRRWPTRAALAAAAIEREMAVGAMPDSGEVAEDLAQHALQNSGNYGSSTIRNHGIWGSLVDPEVRALLKDGYIHVRRQRGLELLERGVSRGQLAPDADLDLILDLMAGMTMYRNLVRDEPLLPQHYRAAAAALVSSPPRI
ncbi:TetR-like C-terminal domain-containing protein [Rhodococcus sp. AD45]|uniref:TetR-like C-terminal domain-containing protein n=1 Tax=Rhodococcus sp. (strain AD45) TaxID=103808 RepID=UPI0005D2E725|nr:TetR-like C-terminal domain-containing protein [Rhodococcus sp. AD45]KJF19258.1 Bacterial regulatory protein, tetR family [Rhodococcus sp. AD45]